jgi:hypothetical protein
LLDAFEDLLLKWRASGAHITRMADLATIARERNWPHRAVRLGEIPGRSGTLAVPAAPSAAAA